MGIAMHISNMHGPRPKGRGFNILMNATFQKFLKEANRTATKSEVYFALGVLFGFCSAMVVAMSLLLTFK